jgi:hypothetical protein
LQEKMSDSWICNSKAEQEFMGGRSGRKGSSRKYWNSARGKRCERRCCGSWRPYPLGIGEVC